MKNKGNNTPLYREFQEEINKLMIKEKNGLKEREELSLGEVYDLITDTGKLTKNQESLLGVSSFCNKGWRKELDNKLVDINDAYDLIEYRRVKNCYNSKDGTYNDNIETIKLELRIRFFKTKEENSNRRLLIMDGEIIKKSLRFN